MWIDFLGGACAEESSTPMQDMQEITVPSLGWGRIPWKKEIATQSCILARKTPWTEEPAELQSHGSLLSLTTTKHAASALSG